MKVATSGGGMPVYCIKHGFSLEDCDLEGNNTECEWYWEDKK